MGFPIWRLNQSFVRHAINASNGIFVRFAGISGRLSRMAFNVDDVIHDEMNNQFYINMGIEKAVLQYQFTGEDNKTLDFYHTGVPVSQRGKGVAGHLVKAAFSFVVAKNLKVRPTCSYVAHYINKNKPADIIQRLDQ